MSKGNGFFSNLSPKASFFIGLGASLLVLFAIGFFVLLGIVMKDDKMQSTKENNTETVKQEKTNEKEREKESTKIKVNVTEDDWVRGNKDAKVTIVEFSDTECPYCKRFHPTMKKLIEENQNVKWVYKHFPLNIHPKAEKEAEAAECAGAIGGADKFWAYLDRIFEITPGNNGLDLAELPNIAEYVGLDREEFQNCLDSGKYAQNVQDDLMEALDAGARGTPYLVILGPNGETIPVSGAVPYEQLDQFVNSLVK